MPLLDSLDYDAIRAAIRTDMDDVELPDEVIALPIYAPAADLSVQGQDPSWDTRTGDEEQHLINAAVYRAAALLIRAFPQVLRREVADMRTQWQPYDSEKRALRLEAMASEELGEVLGDARRFPVVFTAVGSSRRGW